jgi:hypothetical protein
VLAERGTGVLAAEQFPLAQDRDDALDEQLKTGRQDRGHDVEAVGSSRFEPVLDLVGDLLRGADNTGVTSRSRDRPGRVVHRYIRRSVSLASKPISGKRRLRERVGSAD